MSFGITDIFSSFLYYLSEEVQSEQRNKKEDNAKFLLREFIRPLKLRCIASYCLQRVLSIMFKDVAKISGEREVSTLMKTLEKSRAFSSYSIIRCYRIDILAINTKLTHLFVLVTTKTCTLDDLERIQYTLNVYGKILQPGPWASWVH